jgi:hypothetical protein
MGKTGDMNNQRATGRVSLGSVAIVADPFSRSLTEKAFLRKLFSMSLTENVVPQSFFQ